MASDTTEVVGFPDFPVASTTYATLIQSTYLKSLPTLATLLFIPLVANVPQALTKCLPIRAPRAVTKRCTLSWSPTVAFAP